MPRSYGRDQHPFQEAREYTRALNATKLERLFAKPFLANLTGHTGDPSTLTHPWTPDWRPLQRA